MSKRKGGKDKHGAGGEVANAAARLEAVVLADSFDVFQRPVSLDLPRALFPLANTPLLEYTLEFLASNEIGVVYVVCCAHAEKIKGYVEAGRWGTGETSMKIQVIPTPKARSAGDALRDLYTKGLIRNDFILVNGDVVATLDLLPIVQAHQQARQADKEMIVTVVLKEVPPGHPTRSKRDTLMIALEEKGRLLAFEHQSETSSISIPSEWLGNWSDGFNRVQFRMDVLDCRVAICAQEVLFQFQDNFDYPDLPSLVRGIVNEEILGAKVHANVVGRSEGNKAQYAGRVASWRQYAALTKDVLRRWTYPLVPDLPLPPSKMAHREGGYYRGPSVRLSRTAVIGRDCLLGERSEIGGGVKMIGTVLGRSCLIADGASLEESILWDDVFVGKRATVSHSVLAHGVRLGSDVVVGKGSILGAGVEIPDGSVLPPFTKLTLTDGAETEPFALKGAKLKRWAAKEKLPLGTEFAVEEGENAIVADESDSEDEDDGSRSYLSTRASFQKEVAETLARADEASAAGKVNVESVRLEIHNLRLVHDVQPKELVEAILRSVLELPGATPESVGLRWGDLLRHYLGGVDDEKELLYFVAELCESPDSRHHQFTALVESLHKSKALSSNAISSWAEAERKEDPNSLLLQQLDGLLKKMAAGIGQEDDWMEEEKGALAVSGWWDVPEDDPTFDDDEEGGGKDVNSEKKPPAIAEKEDEVEGEEKEEKTQSGGWWNGDDDDNLELDGDE